MSGSTAGSKPPSPKSPKPRTPGTASTSKPAPPKPTPSPRASAPSAPPPPSPKPPVAATPKKSPAPPRAPGSKPATPSNAAAKPPPTPQTKAPPPPPSSGEAAAPAAAAAAAAARDAAADTADATGAEAGAEAPVGDGRATAAEGGAAPPVPAPGAADDAAAAATGDASPDAAAAAAAAGGAAPADAENAAPVLPPAPPRACVPGATKAVVIGCSYMNTVEEVRGRDAAVEGVERCLQETGFRCEVLVLRDDREERLPTREGVASALWWLASELRQGDSVFLSFTGQAMRLKEKQSGTWVEHALCCCDYREAGPVSTDDFHELFLKRLPPNVWVTVVCDFFHGGSLAMLPYQLIASDEDEKLSLDEGEDPTRTAPPSVNLTILAATGSQPVSVEAGMPVGRALIDCFVEVMHRCGGMTTHRRLLQDVKALLNAGQNPVVMTSTKQKLDDVFCLGPKSVEQQQAARQTVQADPRAIVEQAYAVTSAPSARFVEDVLLRRQQESHAHLKMVLKDGAAEVSAGIAALEKEMAARRADDAASAAAQDAAWKAERQAERESDEKWRGIMQGVLDKEDAGRRDAADRWAAKVHVAAVKVDAEAEQLAAERIRFLERRRTEREEMVARWEETLRSLSRASAPAAEPRPPSIIPAVDSKLREADRLISGRIAARREKEAAEWLALERPVQKPQLDPRVADALRSAGAEQYAALFEAAELDAVTFADMTADDFKTIGVKEVGVRIKLARAATRVSTYSELAATSAGVPTAPALHPPVSAGYGLNRSSLY